MAELKPCPFCGKNFSSTYQYSNGGWKVVCGYCGGQTRHFRIREEAIEAWNRRAENEELQFTRQFIHEHGLEFALASAWNRRAEDGK